MNMNKKLMTSSMVIGLLFAAASCGSDKASTSATTAASTTVSTVTSDSTVASADIATTDSATTNSSDIVTTDGGAAGAPDLSGLSADQAKIVTDDTAAAAAKGVIIDPECFVAVVKQLSDADAAAIAASGPGNPPEGLSPAGEALGVKASACVVGGSASTPTT